MNIDKANLSDLQFEALFNDELYNFIQIEKGDAEKFIGDSTIEELRIFIGNWIVDNDECS